MIATSNSALRGVFATQFRLVRFCSCVVFDITVLAWQWFAVFLDEPWGGSLYLPRTVDVVVQHSRLRCD